MDATHALAPLCSYFANVEAPHRPHPTTFHSLEVILIITILGTICGAQNWVEIEQWGQAQQAWLSEFLALPHGIPSHDTFGRVFALLDPASLPQAFVAWMSTLVARCPEIIALDGKAIRRALDRADGKGPIHVVSAWASHNELILVANSYAAFRAAKGEQRVFARGVPANPSPSRTQCRAAAVALCCQGVLASPL